MLKEHFDKFKEKLRKAYPDFKYSYQDLGMIVNVMEAFGTGFYIFGLYRIRAFNLDENLAIRKPHPEEIDRDYVDIKLSYREKKVIRYGSFVS